MLSPAPGIEAQGHARQRREKEQQTQYCGRRHQCGKSLVWWTISNSGHHTVKQEEALWSLPVSYRGGRVQGAKLLAVVKAAEAKRLSSTGHAVTATFQKKAATRMRNMIYHHPMIAVYSNTGNTTAHPSLFRLPTLQPPLPSLLKLTTAAKARARRSIRPGCPTRMLLISLPVPLPAPHESTSRLSRWTVRWEPHRLSKPSSYASQQSISLLAES